MEMTPAIEVRDLHYQYHDGMEVLRGVSLVIGEDEGSVANFAQRVMKGQ
jgi:ABC-type histidine transport system ATPase subunit